MQTDFPCVHVMTDDLPPELDEDGNESDASEESTRELTKEQAELYGEELDAEDEQWVAKKRSGRKSDAHLSCPSCLCGMQLRSTSGVPCL